MEPLYFSTDSCEANAKIVGIECFENQFKIVLDRTIFHPQGGGQKSDVGTIESIPVVHVEKISLTQINHWVHDIGSLTVGNNVKLKIDGDLRLLHSRLHTAGHLIAAIGAKLANSIAAIGGHHWPGEARVDFSTSESWSIPVDFQSQLEFALLDAIEAGLRVSSEVAPTGRLVTIGDFPPVPCGGTHVASLQMIGKIAIRSISKKRDRLRIGYTVSTNPAQTT